MSEEIFEENSDNKIEVEIQELESCVVEDAVDDISEKAQKLRELKSGDKAKPKKKWKKIVFWTMVALVNVGVLLFTLLNDFLNTDGGMITSTVSGILRQHWWWLILAVVAVLSVFVFKALVYAIMMHLFSGKARFKASLSIAVIGQFYSKVTPLGAGAQPMQIYHLQKQKLPDGTAIAIPMIDYTISQLCFVFLSVGAIILNALGVFGTNITMNVGIYVVAIIGVVINFMLPTLLFIALISRRACSKITKFVVRISVFFRITKDPDLKYEKIMAKLDANIACMKLVLTKKRLLLCVALSIATKLAMVSVGYFVIKAFGFETSHGWGWAEIVVINLLIMNAVSIIPTPGGSGAADLSFYVVYSAALLYATDVASGAVATLIWRGISFYLPLLIGFILVMILAVRKKRQMKRELAFADAELFDTLQDDEEKISEEGVHV